MFDFLTNEDVLDVVLETARFVVVACLVAYLFIKRKQGDLTKVNGWGYIMAGFCFLLFGMLIDIADNFDAVDQYSVIGDTPVQAILEKMVGYLGGFALLFVGVLKWLPKIIENQKRTENELAQAAENLERLSGLLPICASCKNIRDDDGYWNKLEVYISEHSQADFTHGICPDCVEKMYSEIRDTDDQATG